MKVINIKNLDRDIKNKTFKQLYLFYGEENYFKKFYLNKFKKVILKEDKNIMNLDIFEGKDINIDDIKNSLNTVPFLNKYRMIIVKNSNFFVSGQKENTEKLFSFIEDMSISSIIFFLEENIDKRNKLFKSIDKIGYAVEFKIPNDDILSKWIIGVCKKENIEIKIQVAKKFINTVSLDMDIINLELNKIINYKDKGEEITYEDIDLVVTKSIDTKIFNLVSAIGNKNCKKALEEYNNLIIAKENSLMILYMISRQIRIILQSKILYDKNYSINEISQKLSLRSFVVIECIKQSKNFKIDKLIKALNDCIDTEVKIKTGQVLNEKLALEMLIIKYTH